jgi:hypothetical protein
MTDEQIVEDETVWLTLAGGTDRWDGDADSGNLRIKEEGAIWLLASSSEGTFVTLKFEVAEWCWNNIGAYRIVDYAPGDIGPHADDCWRIEFKSERDMAFFKMRWMGE